MFHLRLARGVSRVFLVVLLITLFVPAFGAERVGGTKSGSAGIMLRAVLAQSLSMSASPEPVFFNSFVSSSDSRDFPVTIKTNWVRGPGSVSVVVLSSPEWTGFESGRQVFVLSGSAVAPAMEIESGSLPFSADNKNEVLTIRAQVI